MNMPKTFNLVMGLFLAGAASFAACDGDPDVSVSSVPPADAGPDDAAVDVDLPNDSEPPEPAFDCAGDSSSVEMPGHLRCTGLYESWSKKTPGAGVREYKPGVTLWSDGAEKRRWVFLPAGSKVDTTDMNAWKFPVGTKFWKEFSLAGKRVETRMFWKVGETTWLKTTYRWSADESTATRLDAGESRNDAGDPDASGYEIPSVSKCDQCHAGSEDKILGFEAVGLGVAGASGWTLDQLASEGRLTTRPPVTALAIPEDGHGSANALGWLHANCGTACHNASPAASCAFKGMHLKLGYTEVSAATAVTSLEAYTTTHNVAATIPAPGYMRIAATNPGNSAIYYLASHRDNTAPNGQMPPIDTHVVDPIGTGYLNTWISALP